jgi:hypothetical protein
MFSSTLKENILVANRFKTASAVTAYRENLRQENLCYDEKLSFL